jgi:hypothetical protein
MGARWISKFNIARRPTEFGSPIPSQANDVNWLPQWIATANAVVKSFL